MSAFADATLRALPKAELHVHLEGAVAAPTLAQLARKHGVTLTGDDPATLYAFDDLSGFLDMYGLVCDAVRDADDFFRITYEALARIAESGGRYAEMFFSPDAHAGVPYTRMIDGIRAGMRAAEVDLGVIARIVPAHNRERGPQRGLELVETIVAHRGDDVLGIGRDYLENDPVPFATMYAQAAAAGLHRTAHAGEIGPAAFVRDSLDVLGCERIDHGYHVVDDPALVARCRAEGTFFNVCPTTTRSTTDWRDTASPNHAIRQMLDAGLALTVNTDDPGLMRTTLLDKYRILVDDLGATPAQLRDIALNGIRASWLDETTKREWIAAWSVEIDALLLPMSNDDGRPARV